MINYFYVDSSGYITLAGTCQSEELIPTSEGTLHIGEVPSNVNAFINNEFVLLPSSLEEITIETRVKRLTLLSASDWTQYTDVQLSNKSEWATYRQQLRDITEQQGWPTHIIWPQPPA